MINVLPKYEDEPDESRWRRFLLPSFRSVTDLLQNLRGSVKDAEYKVSMLFPGNRFPDHEAVVGTVAEVQVGKDRKRGTQAVVYILAEGRRILDANVASSEEELGALETIYRKEKYVPPSEHEEKLDYELGGMHPSNPRRVTCQHADRRRQTRSRMRKNSAANGRRKWRSGTRPNSASCERRSRLPKSHTLELPAVAAAAATRSCQATVPIQGDACAKREHCELDGPCRLCPVSS